MVDDYVCGREDTHLRVRFRPIGAAVPRSDSRRMASTIMAYSCSAIRC